MLGILYTGPIVVCHFKSRGRLPCRDDDGFFFVAVVVVGS